MSLSEGGPLGIPISRAILLPPGTFGEVLRLALEAIDQVHGDGTLTEIYIDIDPMLDEESMYHWIKPVGIPWNIALRPGTHHPRLNLVHEVGHFLDHQAIGMPGTFASANHAAFERWRETVQTTDAVARLRAVAAQSRNRRAIDYADYLLGVEEMWARSYAQFVTIRSGQSELMVELREKQRRSSRSSLPVQWDETDFLPVEESVAILFRDIGWMR